MGECEEALADVAGEVHRDRADDHHLARLEEVLVDRDRLLRLDLLLVLFLVVERPEWHGVSCSSLRSVSMGGPG